MATTPVFLPGELMDRALQATVHGDGRSDTSLKINTLTHSVTLLRPVSVLTILIFLVLGDLIQGALNNYLWIE